MKSHFFNLVSQAFFLFLFALLSSTIAIAADLDELPKTKIEIYTGEGGKYCSGVIMKDMDTCGELLRSIPPHVPGCYPTQNFKDCMKSGLGIRHSDTSSLNSAINDFIFYANSKIDGVDEPYQMEDFPFTLDGNSRVVAKTNISKTRIFCPKEPKMELDFIGTPQFVSPKEVVGIIRGSYTGLVRKAGDSNLCLKKGIQFTIKIRGDQIYSENLNFEYNHNIKTVAARLGAEVFAALDAPGKEASGSSNELGAEELEKRCGDLGSLEEISELISDVIGVRFRSPQDLTVVEISENLKENLAGLKEGDQLVHINGSTEIWNLLTGICSEGSSLGVIKRNEDVFEVVFSSGKVQPIYFNTVDFPTDNPFLADNGYYEPTWAAFFDGDFSKLSEGEKNILLVIAHSAISDRLRYLYYEDVVHEAAKSITPSAVTCFPYGSESVEWNTYQETMNQRGDVLRSELVNQGTLYFHPAFRQVILGEWEEQSSKGYSHGPVDFVVDKYGCYSPEYRLFYNRMFQLLKGM